ENSPVKLLGAIDQSRLEQLCRDDGFLAHMDRVQNAFDNYLSATTWYEETYGDATPCRIAYFSAEFGLHESVPIYSGGLGVLAGDHLKSASDLGLPLYGGDQDMRIKQEIILGIGGVRALRALGKPPTVCHMNEGHSAFCGLERIRTLMEENKVDFTAAREAVTAGTCFTTHTPVPAGNDVFGPQLIEHYFSGFLG